MTTNASDGWYLAECYWPRIVPGPGTLDETLTQFDAAAASARADVRLLLALCARTDEVLYSLFWAPSLEAVRQVCEQAGLPADRISVGVEALINADAANSLLRVHGSPPRGDRHA
ncbi:hypothetical protein MELE44368_02635 [Mycolicibacterium elephantis DSM 44368]|uniref:Uncharacterized protein n=2 Tax=Mycolicibacterium elephantis TaxID=81858 RepID=A0A439DV08_9MYCO|nr:hypothetical protein MELE44368_02635 [Mycolicibacterium elephantis DSM 44368]